MEDAWTIWFTGLHGSGKSTIADRLAGILKEKDVPFVLLDGDELRKTISSDLGYSLEERNEHMRRVAHLCKKNPKNGTSPSPLSLRPPRNPERTQKNF